MSSPHGGSGQKAGDSASGGSSGITPRSASRFETWQDAHRVITGQAGGDIADRESQPDPSDHEEHGAEDEHHDDSTTLEERQQAERDWFDNAIKAAAANDEPSSGEEVLVSAAETDNHEGSATQQLSQSAHDNSPDTIGHIFDQYAQSEARETATSSGFNPALVSLNAGASNRSASIYRAAPERLRRSGAAGRLGFHGSRQFSEGGNMYEELNVSRFISQIPSSEDSDGPSLPLPIDPPPHPSHEDNPDLPDPSVSSVTNSQALLQGTLSSPPPRAYQPVQRNTNRYNIPTVPPPVPRRNSRRDEQQLGDTTVQDLRFPVLPATEIQSSVAYNIDGDGEWAGPGPAVVRGVIQELPRGLNPLALNPPRPVLAVPGDGGSAPASRSTSGVPESSTSSSRDPFHYDRMFVPRDQERVVTSRLRTMTGNATVFSQSPVNSPERAQGFDDVPLNAAAATQPRTTTSRPQGISSSKSQDQQQFIEDARKRDRSMALGRCNCEFPWYQCRLCGEVARIGREREHRTIAQDNLGEHDDGPYAASPSYRMDARGVKIAGQSEGETGFYIGNSQEGYSSTERIIAHPARNADTSPSRLPRGLQRSDFSTFHAVQRNHRVNGRDGTSVDVQGHSQLRQRRPTLSSYQSQPARLLGQSGGNRSRYEFRDSFQDPAEQNTQQRTIQQQPRRTENWRSLTHPHDQTITSEGTDLDRRATNNDIAGNIDRRDGTMASPYSSDVNSPAQASRFNFPLLPLDEARRRQAEARSRGDEDQTFLSSSTVRPRPAGAQPPSSSVRAASSTTNSSRFSGPFSAFIAQAERAQRRAVSLLPGRRRGDGREATITRTTGQTDSFSSVMRAALQADAEHQQQQEQQEQNLGPRAQPRAFLPGKAGTDSSAPPTLNHPPPPPQSRSFPSSSGRYGNIRDEDIELGTFGAGDAGIERGAGGRGGGRVGGRVAGNRLARRWSS